MDEQTVAAVIKLKRPAAPVELDSTKKLLLTDEYIASGSDVWNKQYIRDALLEISNGKCAYCETKIIEESKYMEIDHFHCKSNYPELVVEWTNLLPSCKKCNGSKSNHDVLIDGMIIDPTTTFPSQHLKMINYRLYGKTKLGDLTEEELDLNNANRLVLPRLKIGNETANALRRIRDDLDLYSTFKTTPSQLKKVKRGIENVLAQAAPDSSYSATAATVIATSPDYSYIMNRLKHLKLWNQYIDAAHIKMLESSLAP